MDGAEMRAPTSRRIELVTGLFVAALVVMAAVFYPPFRDGIDDARRSVASLLGMPDWAGYYLQLDTAALPGEVSSPQLLFTSGSFPGRGARIVDPPVFEGRWSPSGEQFAFTSGRRLLIGDRNGAVRALGELLDLVPAGPLVWVHEDEILLTMTRPGSEGWWYVRIDPRTGLLIDQRALARHLVIESISADGLFALAWSGQAPAEPTRASLVLYELSTAREVAAPEGAAFAGWAPDGRVLVRVNASARWRLEAREPGSVSGEALVELTRSFDVPVGVRGNWIALLERDADPRSSAAIWLVKAGSEPVQVAGDMGEVYEASPSADGRYVAFSQREERASGVVLRSGIVVVASGRVTYACDSGCAELRLR